MRTRFTEQKPKSKLPAIIISIILWVCLFLMVYFVQPQMPFVLLFLFVLFAGLLFSLALLLKSSLQGLIFALAIVVFLTLRLLGIGNILNLLLIVGIVVAVEIFLRNK